MVSVRCSYTLIIGCEMGLLPQARHDEASYSSRRPDCHSPADRAAPSCSRYVTPRFHGSAHLHVGSSDLSKQSITQVPATSSNTWGTLLRSSVAETIQPNADRWRSGLDALLVFVSLRSSSMYTESMTSLSFTAWVIFCHCNGIPS